MASKQYFLPRNFLAIVRPEPPARLPGRDVNPLRQPCDRPLDRDGRTFLNTHDVRCFIAHIGLYPARLQQTDDNLWELEAQLPHREVDSRLGDTIPHHRHRGVSFQLPVEAHLRGDGQELGVAGLLKEVLHGAEEEDCAEDVGQGGIEEVLLGGPSRWSVVAEDAGIYDHHVEVADVVGKIGGSRWRIGRIKGIEASYWTTMSFAASAGGQGGEGIER